MRRSPSAERRLKTVVHNMLARGDAEGNVSLLLGRRLDRARPACRKCRYQLQSAVVCEHLKSVCSRSRRHFAITGARYAVICMHAAYTRLRRRPCFSNARVNKHQHLTFQKNRVLVRRLARHSWQMRVDVATHAKCTAELSEHQYAALRAWRCS